MLQFQIKLIFILNETQNETYDSKVTWFLLLVA